MSIGNTAQFDPSREVPDEYEVFCESCGYSLAGLATDHCPECGGKFDPADLPFARIPWLHRRRLGKVTAYLRTVRLVCLHPAAFARELCRPVRISAADARGFRLATIRLLTIFALFVALAAIAFAAIRVYQIRIVARQTTTLTPADLVFISLSALAAVGAVHMFLRLATDMPLFIWKGHPSLKPAELSPVHQYASAPLALAPFAVVLFVYLIYLREASMLAARKLFTQMATAEAVIVPLWLWAVALVLMAVSTRAKPRRLLLMAAYLPLHWFLMLALSGMVWLLFTQAERVVNDAFHLQSMLFR
jgi:hypothetical protein